MPIDQPTASRAAVSPADVDHAVFGSVTHTQARDVCLSRMAAVNGGLGEQTRSVTGDLDI